MAAGKATGIREAATSSTTHRCTRLQNWKRRHASTEVASPPPGYTLDAYSVELGSGESLFDRAKDAVARFAHYPASFSRVVQLEGPLRPGLVFGTVATHLGFASLHPCRVLFVIDEPRCFGFGLGTLPGHVVIGEESFILTRGDGDGGDERVRLQVRAVSRATSLLGRLGRPLTRIYQRRFQRELGAALLGAVRAGPTCDQRGA